MTSTEQSATEYVALRAQWDNVLMVPCCISNKIARTLMLKP